MKLYIFLFYIAIACCAVRAYSQLSTGTTCKQNAENACGRAKDEYDASGKYFLDFLMFQTQALDSNDMFSPAFARRAIDDCYPPLPLHGDSIGSQNRTLQRCSFNGWKDEKNTIIEFGKSVGRLLLRPISSKPNATPSGPYQVSTDFWSTAFVIAPGILATSCHSIDAFVKKGKTHDVELNFGPNQMLVIDFGEELGLDGYKDENQYQVTRLLACSSRTGLDVALLKVSDTPLSGDNPLPLPVPLWTDDLDQSDILQPPVFAVVGYPDLLHPVDYDTDNVYAPFKPGAGREPYAKFVMPSFVVACDRCDSKLTILMDYSATTVGESGGILIDLTHNAVVGMHTCCSTYFDEYNKQPPQADRKCARLKRTYSNQSISVQSILKDPALRKRLTDAQTRP